MAAAAAAAPTNPSPLDVHIALSSNTVMLGQPLWVDVAVTNRSNATLAVDIGNTCFGARPIIIDVAAAEPQVDKQNRCGAADAGDCLVPGPSQLAPDATLRKRYVLEGDFRITHAGEYHVRVTKPVLYGPANEPSTMFLAGKAQTTTTVVDTTLVVQPPDPAKLIELERGLVVQAMATVAPARFPPGADLETQHRIIEEHREATIAWGSARLALMEGLTTFPAPGLEPTFDSWLHGNQGGYEASQALTALYNLDTPDARADLADVAQSTGWNAEQAATYLGFMGDQSYLPLLERLSHANVQAVIALGTLGGEKELQHLESLVQNATSDSDRIGALMAIGYTGTLNAVPFLISRLDSPGEASAAGLSLFWLTHHRLAPVQSHTFHDAAIAWRTWWAQNQTTVHVYRPWECDEQKQDLVHLQWPYSH